jgi:arylsulfatase A-like enzyme
MTDDGTHVFDAPEEHMVQFRDKDLIFHPNYAPKADTPEVTEKNLRGYYAQITNLDDNTGRVIRALEETGQLDNTIVLYFSDHGDMMGSHGGRQKSRPEEESTRIPFIIRWPQKIKPQVTDALISGVDIMPTILGLAGVACPDTVEGTDISPVLRGEADSVTDEVLVQYNRAFFAYTNADHECFRTLRQGDWKYTVYLTVGAHQLFNIAEDRYEMNNLIDSPEHADIREQLDQRLRKRCTELRDDFFERLKKYTA